MHSHFGEHQTPWNPRGILMNSAFCNISFCGCSWGTQEDRQISRSEASIHVSFKAVLSRRIFLVVQIQEKIHEKIWLLHAASSLFLLLCGSSILLFLQVLLCVPPVSPHQACRQQSHTDKFTTETDLSKVVYRMPCMVPDFLLQTPFIDLLLKHMNTTSPLFSWI